MHQQKQMGEYNPKLPIKENVKINIRWGGLSLAVWIYHQTHPNNISLFSFLYLFSNRFSISHICFAYQLFHPINVKRTSYEISMVWKQRHRIIWNTYSTEYTECQAFCPVVRIGSHVPHPLTHKGVLLPPLVGSNWETHSLAGEGVGDPIPAKEKTLCYSAYIILYFLYVI